MEFLWRRRNDASKVKLARKRLRSRVGDLHRRAHQHVPCRVPEYVQSELLLSHVSTNADIVISNTSAISTVEAYRAAAGSFPNDTAGCVRDQISVYQELGL